MKQESRSVTQTEPRAESSPASKAAEPKKPAGSKVRLTEFDDTHLPGVLALYNEVFGPAAAREYENRWRWSLRENLVPDHSPAWVVTDGDEKVVGFLATVPQRYMIDGEEIVAHSTADYMVHPKHRFHGVSLMKRFFKECENCITADDMAATVKVTTWLGAKDTGVMRRYVKLLDGRSLKDRKRFRRVPSFGFWPVTLGLRILDKLRPAARGSRVDIERCEQFDPELDSFYERLAGTERAVLKRDHAFLKWRYGPDSPQPNRWIIKATLDDGQIAGYAVYSMGAESHRAGNMLDLQVAPESSEAVARALIKIVVADLRKMGAWTCRFYSVVSPGSVVEEALLSWGFRPRSGHRLLVKLQDPRLMAVAEQAVNWNYVYGDSEASHSAL